MVRRFSPGRGTPHLGAGELSVADGDLKAEAERRPRGLPILARWVLDVFYRRVEVVGASKVRERGALVMVGNHVAALLDPALFMAYLPRPPRFLAKSTLWHNPLLVPLLKMAAAIPVFRRQDPGVDPGDNLATFRLCHEVLAADGVVGLFPEGQSHNEPALTPLKTGVARIVLQAMARFPDLDVEIVPVGLTFDDKTRFRSRVLVAVGEPIRPADVLGPRSVAPAADGQAVDADPNEVRALTEQVRRGLAEVTLNYPSWEEARLIERAASIFARPEPAPPVEAALEQSFSNRKLFIEGYRKMVERFPEDVHAVAAEVREYEQDLEVFRVSDAQVAADYPPRLVLRFTAESLIMLLWWLPLGALGTLLNILPFQAAGLVARRFSTGPDSVATYKLLPSLLLYPATWLLEGLGAGLLWGGWAGLAAAFLAPVSGYYAIRLHQRGDLFLRHARAFMLWRGGSRRLRELRRQRRRVLEAVHRLAEHYQPGTAD